MINIKTHNIIMIKSNTYPNFINRAMSSPDNIIKGKIHDHLKINFDPDIEFVRTVTVSCDGSKKGKKCVYQINNPENIYLHGFRNLKCKYVHLIDYIEFIFGGSLIAKIDNTNGKIIPKLREIFNITNDIIPCIGMDKFIPYSNVYRSEIYIKFFDSEELNTIDDFVLTYDEIKIIDTDSPMEYILNDVSNKDIIIDDKKIDLLLTYSVLGIEFTGEELCDKTICKYRLNFMRMVEKILIFCPNHSIKNCRLVNYDNYNIIPITMEYHDNDFILIKIINKFNANAVRSLTMEVLLENISKSEKNICIYGIGDHQYYINGTYTFVTENIYLIEQ